jgi:tetratricopeptide (TPR) repeat protein
MKTPPAAQAESLDAAAKAVSEELIRFQDQKTLGGWELEIQSMQTAADLASSQGRYEDASRLYKSALLRLVAAENAGEDTRLTRVCLQNNHALLLKRLESLTEAEELLKKSIQLMQREGLLEIHITAELHENLGRLYASTGRFAEAVQAHQSAQSILRLRPADALPLAECLIHQGLAALRLRNDDMALDVFAEAVTLLAARPKETRSMLDALICLATAQVEAAHFSDAENTLRDCLTRSREMKVPVHLLQAVLWKMLGCVFVRTSRVIEAIQAFRAALHIYEDAYATDLLGMAEAHFNLGVLSSVKRDEGGFRFHMRQAADLIDEQQTIARERDTHFRGIFESHFNRHGHDLGVNQIGSLLMLNGADMLGAPSEWSERAR